MKIKIPRHLLSQETDVLSLRVRQIKEIELERKDERQRVMKKVWDLFNANGISVIPSEGDTTMNITISHTKKGKNELSSNITFSRKSEVGILCFLSDEQWKKIKEGNL